jgi:transposase
MPTAFTTRERRRIIELFRQGLEGDDVAEVMNASPAGVRRVWQQFREEGRDHDAYANCGRKPTLDEVGQQTLLTLARARPDAFCRELADDLHAATGVRLSRQRIGRLLTVLGLTRKKVASRQRAGASGRKAAA